MCVHFVTCPKQGLEIEAVVLHRVGFLAYFCPKQGQDFKPSSAPLYPNMGQVPPRGCGTVLPRYVLHTLTRNIENESIYKENLKCWVAL